MSFEFSSSNPFRIPAWRWERAGEIVDGGPAFSRSRDDAWVKKGVQFRQLLRRCNDRYDRAVLESRMSDIFWAHELSSGTTEPIRHGRGELEARILAQQSSDEIAQKLATSKSVVEAYVALFFDVRQRLVNASYIVHTVIGNAIHQGVDETNIQAVWKLFGYLGGPFVLDALITTAIDPIRPRAAAEVGTFFDGRLGDSLRRKAMLAAHSYRARNGEDRARMIELMLGYMDREREGRTSASSANTLSETVQALLVSLKLPTADQTMTLPDFHAEEDVTFPPVSLEVAR